MADDFGKTLNELKNSLPITPDILSKTNRQS